MCLINFFSLLNENFLGVKLSFSSCFYSNVYLTYVTFYIDPIDTVVIFFCHIIKDNIGTVIYHTLYFF